MLNRNNIFSICVLWIHEEVHEVKSICIDSHQFQNIVGLIVLYQNDTQVVPAILPPCSLPILLLVSTLPPSQSIGLSVRHSVGMIVGGKVGW